MLSATFRIAKRRTSRSLFVKPPSRNTECENRLVVTIGTTIPVSSKRLSERLEVLLALLLRRPNGKTSLSWKVTP